MPIANDTFVEGSDTALASHTPTGPNAGTSWSQISGAVTVRGATDDCIDNSGGGGNRCRMTNDLGQQHRVQASVSFGADYSGSFVSGGVDGRIGSAGEFGYEFYYSWSDGKWILDSPTVSNTLTEAWGTPSTPQTLKLDIFNSNEKGYANGVQKVALTTNEVTGQHCGGMVFLNFTGGAGKIIIDNYQSETLAGGPLIDGGENTRGALIRGGRLVTV